MQVPQKAETVVYTPLKALNLYSTDWVIRVRLTKKYDVKTFKNSRGEGRVLSLELLDEEGTQMMAVIFGRAIEDHYDFTVHILPYYL